MNLDRLRGNRNLLFLALQTLGWDAKQLQVRTPKPKPAEGESK